MNKFVRNVIAATGVLLALITPVASAQNTPGMPPMPPRVPKTQPFVSSLFGARFESSWSEAGTASEAK
ncbi:MAG: hypothetical protein WBQ94_02030 [Terracidiphilus sp.]